MKKYENRLMYSVSAVADKNGPNINDSNQYALLLLSGDTTHNPMEKQSVALQDIGVGKKKMNMSTELNVSGRRCQKWNDM